MASSACTLKIASGSWSSCVNSVPTASVCSSSINRVTSAVICSCNGPAKLQVSSLSCAERNGWNAASCAHGFRKSGKGLFHSGQFLGKKRIFKWIVVEAVYTGTSQSSEAGTSEESAPKLVSQLLALVKDSDRGANLGAEKQANVADVVGQLEKIGIPEPLKSPLIFGDWNVAYSSNPTSPGGGYRTWFGRLIFRTRDMIQSINAPDIVVNVVRFALFGLIGGEVTLEGKLTPLDDKMIQVDFRPPHLQIGPFKFSYGGMSAVKIAVIYLDDKIRLGRGSRGTVFVFTRR